MRSVVNTAFARVASVSLQAIKAACIHTGFGNDAAKSIRCRYVSPSTYRGWSRGFLGADALNPGNAELIATCFDTNDGNYDFRPIYPDGSSNEWRNRVNAVGSTFLWVDRQLVLCLRPPC